jgi:hypothetical protein
MVMAGEADAGELSTCKLFQKGLQSHGDRVKLCDPA